MELLHVNWTIAAVIAIALGALYHEGDRAIAAFFALIGR